MAVDDARRLPTQPRNVGEMLRITHALRWGAHFPPGQCYIVMSTVPPLFQIQGIARTLNEARALLDGGVPQSWNWTPDEKEDRRIFGPIDVPVPWYENAFGPIIKPWFTGTFIDEQLMLGGENAKPASPNEVTACGLTVNWTHDGEPYTRTWNLPRDTMAIFLTRGAAEMFLYPHCDAFFGSAYEDALRARNGHPRGGGNPAA